MWLTKWVRLASDRVAICREWIRRGHADTVLDTLVRTLGRAPRSQAELRRLGLLPAWLGSRSFHRAHRSALVRKDPAWYGPMFPDVPDDLPYVWPPSPRPS